MLRAGTDIPIDVDNGANTLGQAEMWFGAGRGAEHAVIALVGSGVGAAVVANGVSYRGARSSAGEWGHTTIVVRRTPVPMRCAGMPGGLRRRRGRARPVPAGQPRPGRASVPTRSRPSPRCSRPRTPPRSRPEVLDETIGYLGAGYRQPGQPVQPRADRARRLGRTGAGASGTCRRSAGGDRRGTRCDSRSRRCRSSCASSARTPSPSARPPCRCCGCSARAAPRPAEFPRSSIGRTAAL